MAICLAIVGYMVGFALHGLMAASDRQCIEATQQQLVELQTAVEEFAMRNGRYPLPAGAGLAPGDSRFGYEAASGADPLIARVPGAAPILVGAFPASADGLTHRRGIDCWGQKITYAVTESLTTPAGYADGATLGGITLMYGRLAAPQTLSSNVAYMILSHGPDKVGANAAGYAGTPVTCNGIQADASDLRIDKENCDTNNAIFYNGEFNDGSVPLEHFDDVVTYGEKTPTIPADCDAATISWGGGCEAPALITLNGLSVPLTNIASGYTGTAVSVCTNGVRTTLLGVCLPVGVCSTTSPRTGNPLLLLTGVGVNYGTGICKQYKCCSGVVTATPIWPCPLIDLPGLALSCP